jgi:glutamate synthase domain-containing protein 1
MFFLPPSDPDCESERSIEEALHSRGLRLLAWRSVPIDADQLGEAARPRCRASGRP